MLIRDGIKRPKFRVSSTKDIEEDKLEDFGFEIQSGRTIHGVKFGSYQIVVTGIEMINRLPSPYRSDCTNGEGGLNVFPGPYTRRKCAISIIFKNVLRHCDNVPDHWRKFVKPYFEREWDENYGNRSHKNVFKCMVYHYYSYFPFEDKVDLAKCPLPCKEISVEIRTEALRIYNVEKLKNGYSNFHVKHQSKRITEITEVPVYTSDNFFSDVGSWLGLLVGMSFLSIVELITFAFATAHERFCRYCFRGPLH